MAVQGKLDLTETQSTHWWSIKRRLTEPALGVGASLISVLLMYVSLQGFDQVGSTTYALAWWTYGFSVCLLVVAAPALEGRWTELATRFRPNSKLTINIESMIPWLILGAILVLATAIRLYNLEDIPAGLWFDEADNLAHASRYAEDPGRIPPYEPSTNLPTLFLLPIAGLVKLVGVDVTTPRLVASAFGLLGIVATFLFVRHAMGVRAGLIAAFFIAVMRWDIIWSRIGMHGITGILFASLSAWLTLRAIRTGRVSDYIFAGASMGLGMWFYAPLRVFPLVIALLLLHHLIVRRPRGRRFIYHSVIMFATALFVSAPIVLVATNDPEMFFARARTTSVFQISPIEHWVDDIRTSLIRHGLMFNLEGDANGRHNLPGAPMLDFFMGSLFALGFFFALTRWRDTALFSLPIWVLIMILPGVFTVPWESPQSLRSIVVIPAVAGLAAYVVDRVWMTGREAPWMSVRIATIPLMLGLLGIIGFSNISLYFGQQANDPRVYSAFSTEETLMTESQIEQRGRGYSLWVSRQFLFSLTHDLLAHPSWFEVIKAPETIPLDSSEVWRGAASYFEPRERGFWETLQVYYPDGDYRIETPPDGEEPLFYTAIVSREQLSARQGLSVSYIKNEVEIKGRQETVSESSWHPDAGPSEYPYTVRMAGALHIRDEGEYQITLAGNAQAVVELDGRIIVDQGRTGVRFVPAIGLHHLAITSRITSPEEFIRILWTTPVGTTEVIPFGRLYRDTVRPVGLVGRFFMGGDSSGIPHVAHISPTMDLSYFDPVMPEPYFATWEGFLDVPVSGHYRFRVRGFGSVELYLDNTTIARTPGADGIGEEGGVYLDEGRYSIRVDYRPEMPPSRLSIEWAPPDDPFHPIPIDSMTPEPGHMLRIVT